jgi:sugar phosphate isomerase/epimerase
MLNRREMLAASAGVFIAASAQADEKPRSKLGVVIHSYGIRSGDSRRRKEDPPFSDPLVFLAHCKKHGAAGIQTGIGLRDKNYTAKLRKTSDDAGMYLEGVVRLPDDKKDAERFEGELRTARDAGATILRTVCMNGRRYETFTTAAAFEQFAAQAYERLTLAEAIAAKVDVELAVENHKDWRADQLAEILKKLSSKHVGCCVDTGNNIALLDDPHETVETLAPWAFTTHFKDMSVAEYADGFLLSEVPLGSGYLDLPHIVKTLRKHQPRIRFNLEMITRDPLKIPCLTKHYWTTFDTLPAKHLAATLETVKKKGAKLPEISKSPIAKQLEDEEEFVRLSFERAGKILA